MGKYTAAVAALFDPATSRADLISISEDPSDDVITLRWRLEGRLKLLGGLPIKPYTGALRRRPASATEWGMPQFAFGPPDALREGNSSMPVQRL